MGKDGDSKEDSRLQCCQKHNPKELKVLYMFTVHHCWRRRIKIWHKSVRDFTF